MQRKRSRRTATDLTTSEVAKLCGMSPKTVVQWANEGFIRCYRLPPIPGSKYGGRRRFAPKHVAAFMRQHGMPIHDDHKHLLAEVMQ